MWHKSCFTCGALSDLGCKRVLITPISPDYFHHFGCPFCHGCTNKIFMHGELHIFPSGPEECSPAETPYDQRSPSKEHSSIPYEENSKAKKAYRNRVRAGVSQPHSPIEYPDGEYKKFDVENMTINHTFLFSEIYKDRTEGTDGGEVSSMEAKNTEMDGYSEVKNSSTQDYTALNYVLSRLQMLEDIRIKEAKEARDEYFHRFENTEDRIEGEGGVRGDGDGETEAAGAVLGEDTLVPLECSSAYSDSCPLAPASSFAFPLTSTSTSTSVSLPVIALTDSFNVEVEVEGGDDSTISTSSNVTVSSSAGVCSGGGGGGGGVGMIEELDEGRIDHEGNGEEEEGEGYYGEEGEEEGEGGRETVMRELNQSMSSNGSSTKSTPSKLPRKIRPSLNVSSTKTEAGVLNQKKGGERGVGEDGGDEEDGGDGDEDETIESDWSDRESSNPTNTSMTQENINDEGNDDKHVKGIGKSKNVDKDKEKEKDKEAKNSGKNSEKEYESISDKIRRKKSIVKKKEIQSVYHEIFEKKYDDNEVVSETISEKIQRNKSIVKKKEIQSVYHEIFEKKFDEISSDKLLKKKQKTDSFILPVLWKF